MSNLDSMNSLTAEMALDLVERWVYAQKGIHLNDLERQVFLGSWQGQTYEEIYPLNPEYVEKSVGYKLWRKLSDVMGEKVSKKRIQGAVIRRSEMAIADPEATPTQLPCCRLHIIYQARDRAVQETAQALAQLLQTAGHAVLLKALEEPQSIASASAEGLAQGDWLLLIKPAGAMNGCPGE